MLLHLLEVLHSALGKGTERKEQSVLLLKGCTEGEKKRRKLRIQNLSNFLWGKADTTVGPDCVLNERVPWKPKKKALFYLYSWFSLSVFFCLFLCNAGLGFCHFEGNREAKSPHASVVLVVPYMSPCATSKPPRDRRRPGQGAAAFSLPLPQRAPALWSTKGQNEQCWEDWGWRKRGKGTPGLRRGLLSSLPMLFLQGSHIIMHREVVSSCWASLDEAEWWSWLAPFQEIWFPGWCCRAEGGH